MNAGREQHLTNFEPAAEVIADGNGLRLFRALSAGTKLYAAPPPQAVPIAWVHADDPSQAISSLQKDRAIRDGGASTSSVAPYSIAAYARSDGALAPRAELPELIEQIAQQWDGCEFDAVGEAIDIGAAIRLAARNGLKPAAPECICCGCGGCKSCLGARKPCPKHSSAAAGPEPDDTPLETGEGDARDC